MDLIFPDPSSTVPDHAGRAADHVLALASAVDPTYRATAELHDACVDLVRAVVGALVVGRHA